MHVHWHIDPTPIEYEAALAAMEKRVADIHSGIAPEQVWLLEHPAL